MSHIKLRNSAYLQHFSYIIMFGNKALKLFAFHKFLCPNSYHKWAIGSP